jgi:rRNA-processing protein FCF1
MDPIILDTNSLIYAIKNRIDIENEIIYLTPRMKPVVPKCVITELRGLGTSKWYAKAALKYSERFEQIESRGEGDFCIMMTALSLHAAVLTNDRRFIKRLKLKGVTCVTISDRHTLEFY